MVVRNVKKKKRVLKLPEPFLFLLMKVSLYQRGSNYAINIGRR